MADRGMPWRTRMQKVQALALSAAAIGMTYEAGYLLVTGPVGAAQATAAVALVPPAQPGQYRDGTYTGAAGNVYGAVQVEVTITSGRVGQVRITNATTFYPTTYLDGLPDQVVVAQSADVPVVSGATGSWQDFTAAVQDALIKAAAAGPTRTAPR
jgi:uncharacterized protein with FMN-binding domain